jgi:DNA polymerase III alpha subunit
MKPKSLLETLTKNMMSNQYGELVFSAADIFDTAMSGKNVTDLADLMVDHSVDIASLLELIPDRPAVATWRSAQDSVQSVEEYDCQQQQNWHMPEEYQQLDIAAHILSLCDTTEQLQRAGEELLLYQDRKLFDLLRYLKYLVDTMTSHNIVWGVGRGSSVASYVLYLLKIHRIDSMFYDLDPREFLR